MADNRLRAMLARGEFFAAPGVFDAMSAMLAERVGFDAVYASGYWLTASYLEEIAVIQQANDSPRVSNHLLCFVQAVGNDRRISTLLLGGRPRVLNHA